MKNGLKMEKNKNLEIGTQTTSRSCIGWNGVSFMAYALSFCIESKRRVVWRCTHGRSRVGPNGVSFVPIERLVVQIRKKRRVVSCYQTTCRSSVAGLFSLVTKTTSFWIREVSQFLIQLGMWTSRSPCVTWELRSISCHPPYSTNLGLETFCR